LPKQKTATASKFLPPLKRGMVGYRSKGVGEEERKTELSGGFGYCYVFG